MATYHGIFSLGSPVVLAETDDGYCSIIGIVFLRLEPVASVLTNILLNII